jgi:Spy/CpxP family protein refolding chaperone
VITISCALVAGCGGGQQTEPPPAAQAPATASAPLPPPAPVETSTTAPPAASAAPQAPAAEPEHDEAKEAREHHHPMLAWLFSSLGEVEIRPDQKAEVATIEEDLEKASDPPPDLHRKLVNDLADGVAAGKIDKAKTDADVKELTKWADSSTPAVQDAMNRLHKTLDPAQRKKLVETMHAKAEAHHEGMMEHGGMHGEHGGMHGEHEGMGPGGMEHGHGPGAHAAELADELGLTADQKAKLEKALEQERKTRGPAMKKKMEAGKQQMEAIGNAFETETFDAKKAGVGTHHAEMIRDMTEARLSFVQTVLPILTPEQRTKFADHIRAHADHDEHEGMH